MAHDYKTIIALWPTVTAFGVESGIEENLARRYVTLNRIAARHWPGVVAAAAARGFSDVTLAALAEIEAQRDASMLRQRRRPQPPPRPLSPAA